MAFFFQLRILKSNTSFHNPDFDRLRHGNTFWPLGGDFKWYLQAKLDTGNGVSNAERIEMIRCSFGHDTQSILFCGVDWFCSAEIR